MSINTMMISQLQSEEIHQLENIWKELSLQHHEQSTHFKEYFSSITFQQRCEKLLEMDELGIFTAKDGAEIIAYCIVSYHKGIGEIDSLFVSKNYRGRTLGETLVMNSIEWLNAYNCDRIKVSVAEGNEHVLAFYERCGFKMRSYVLQL